MIIFTATNPSEFRETWKMYWVATMVRHRPAVAGGGTNSNINFGVFTPPSTAIGALQCDRHTLHRAAGWAQDIVDFIIDPANETMYTVMVHADR